MYLKILLPALLCLLAMALPAGSQPVIRPLGVQNAASNVPAGRPGQGLAPGSIFVVKGIRLGPPDLLQAAPPYPTRLPDEEGGTRITITPVETGIPIDTEVLYTWEWQTAGLLPAETPLGPADVTVSWQGEPSSPARVEIMPTAPGLFTLGMNGSGPGVIQNYTGPEDQPLNSLTRPALPGQYLILWGTGLGATGDRWFDTDAFGRRCFGWACEIELGDLRLRPSYAGPAPGYPGLDQINVRLPDDGSLLDDCYAELRVRISDYTSPPVTVATARQPGACSHPMGLSPDTLARLDAGGRVPLADITIRQREFQDNDGSVRARLVSVAAPELAGLTPSMTPAELPIGCARFTGVFPIVIFSSEEPIPMPPAPNPFVPLDAGESLLLTGPGGRSLSLTRYPDGASYGGYVTERPPLGFFAPGDWRISAPGGADTGTFSASITLPPAPRPEIPATLDRSTGFPVSWPTDGFAPHDIVTVTVSSHTSLPKAPHIENAAVLRCVAAATDGAVTFPPALLQELRSLDNGQVNVNVVSAPDNWTTFTAPGIEYGKFTWNRAVSRAIEIQ